MAFDGCISSGLDLMTELGGKLFHACWVISAHLCFAGVILVGRGGIFEKRLPKCEARVSSLFQLGIGS